jgi:hypothetical protein
MMTPFKKFLGLEQNASEIFLTRRSNPVDGREVTYDGPDRSALRANHQQICPSRVHDKNNATFHP